MWRRQRSLSLETPYSRIAAGTVYPLERLLDGLVVPEDATVTTLSLQIASNSREGVAGDVSFSRVMRSLEPFRALRHLTSLELDDSARVTPADIATIALTWPHLTHIYFGVKTVYSGTAAELASAFAALPKLRKLQWPWPAEPGRSPEDAIYDLAIKLPQLELACLDGQHGNRMQWFRITCGRGGDGRPDRLEPGKMVWIELDRPG